MPSRSHIVHRVPPAHPPVMPAIPKDWATPPPRLPLARAKEIRSLWSKLIWQARAIAAASPETLPAYQAFRDNRPPIVHLAFSTLVRHHLKSHPNTNAILAMAKARAKGLPARSIAARLDGYVPPPDGQLVTLSSSAAPKPGQAGKSRSWSIVFLQIPHPVHNGLFLRFKASPKAGAFVSCRSLSRGRLLPSLRPFAHNWKPLSKPQIAALTPAVRDFLNRASFGRILS